MRKLLAGLGFMIIAIMAGPCFASGGETGFLDRSVTVDGASYRYQVYVPLDYTPDKSWPVTLFLHGSGERGEDGIAQTQAGIGDAIRRDRKRFPMIVVMPQAPANTRWSGARATLAMKALEESIVEFHGDRQRLYLTGMSMGGQGVWLLAAANPRKFAALAPVCGFLRLENDDDVIDPAQDRALLAQFPELLEPDPAAAFARTNRQDAGLDIPWRGRRSGVAGERPGAGSRDARRWRRSSLQRIRGRQSRRLGSRLCRARPGFLVTVASALTR